MKCSKCGNELPKGAKFCVKCGTKMDEVTKPAKAKKNDLMIFLISFLTVLLVGIFVIGGLLVVRNNSSADYAVEDDEDDEEDEDRKSSKKHKNDDEDEAEEDDDEGNSDSDSRLKKLLHKGEAEPAEVEEAEAPAETEEYVEEEEAEPEVVEEETIDEADLYMIEGSDSRYIDRNDLSGFSAEDCRIARNEIYARHGRMFDDEELQAYFDSKNWYDGYIKASDFKESMLNDYEIANRDFIVKYEKDMGYR